ncbi:lema family protein [Variovorax guangxiensis]|uniref:lema family protein n=1 Tax=Variovorax guangxiensis TaxID=1775474 RepID=UPI00285C7BC5|nr:lema family protein [Variovorax guangxiensis]MDR6861168.1 LemA protein [Variovorax guangxiensis]
MNGVPDSLLWWILGAVALFWFVGAYNRIVRLRSGALQAYAALDAALVRQIDFVQARLAEGGATAQAPHGPGREDAALQASAAQLVTLLAATRLKPLDPAGIAALATALHVMLGAWQRLHPDAVVSFEADGTLSRPAPLNGRDDSPAAPIAWPEPSAAAEIARNQFNQAVAHYNAAIAQFPAVLVAWIMQLRPAAPLR